MKFAWTMVIFILLLPIRSIGAIDRVARSEIEFRDSATFGSKNIRVASVTVVLADYELIARDFPEAQRHESETKSHWHSRVDFWLVDKTGFIHKNQTIQTTVNSQIETLPEEKLALRPRGYNRAHVIAVDDGYIDAKGTGTRNPKFGAHSNGLATLGEMIREFNFEKLVERIFENEGSKMKTVGSYAVLDYGFDVVHPSGNRDRAGYILRQAHKRSFGYNSMLPVDQAIEMEKVLRKYGITGSGETYAKRAEADYDYTNLQGTNNSKVSELVDFGAFLAIEEFKHQLINEYRETVMGPGMAEFVQPDPMVRVPLEQWGNSGTQDPKYDKPWISSHELARAWAEGRANRTDILQHHANLLGPFEKKLHETKIKCSHLLKP